MTTIKRTISWLLVGSAVLGIAYTTAAGVQQQQPDTQQRLNVQDPIRELNLSPEQREQIRAIREQLREERAATNQRLREANQALEEALDADNPDEALLEKLMRDVAAAQAATTRMRILSELKIRRVLTLEQLVKWRRLRKEAMQERRRDDNRRLHEAIERRRGLANPRNTLEPLYPRVDPRRRPRP